MKDNKNESLNPLTVIITIVVAISLSIIIGNFLFKKNSSPNKKIESQTNIKNDNVVLDTKQNKTKQVEDNESEEPYFANYLRHSSEAKEIPLPTLEEESSNYPEVNNDLNKHERLTFNLLASFDYEKIQKIPDNVRAYNNKKVYIIGFMLPIQVKDGMIHGFLLLRSQAMCCFGITPKMNEWVIVDMEKPCNYYPDIPVKLYGTITVDEEKVEGATLSLYKMKGDLLLVPNNSTSVELLN